VSNPVRGKSFTPGLIALATLLASVTCFGQSYTLTTVAGAGFSSAPLPAPAVNEGLDDDAGVAVDSAGNIYFGGGIDNVVYKISGGILSVVAGTVGSSGYSGDGGPATSALLNNPQGVAVDSSGNLYIVDYLNYVIRKVSDGTITTIAGNGSYGPPVNGPATATPMYTPIGIAVDGNKNVYVGVGSAGGYIVKIANGTLTIVAGIGQEGTVTSGGSALAQPVVAPHFLSVDAAGNVYISGDNGYILRLNIGPGTIDVVAGNGAGMFSGDGGPATNAGLTAYGVAVDSAGNIFIADTGNGRIREVSNGVINTIAGGDKTGSSCSSTPVAGSSAYINNPAGIAVSGSNVYFGAASCIQQLTGATTSGPPSVKSGGIISASSFGAFTAVAPSSWIEIYGSNLAATTENWTNAFTGVNAPISLGGTSVTIGGQSAFIDYVSPGQVNAQVPSNVTAGTQPVVVMTSSGSSTSTNITVNATEPGLLAPSAFLIERKQYVGALSLTGTYVLPPGSVSGLSSQAAQPGDTIILYGVGFGPVTPATPAGQIVSGTNALVSPIRISIGGVQAQVTYAGLSPGSVGLYQFNVVVPSVSANNATPVTFTLGGVAGTQTLYTAVQ